MCTYVYVYVDDLTFKDGNKNNMHRDGHIKSSVGNAAVSNFAFDSQCWYSFEKIKLPGETKAFSFERIEVVCILTTKLAKMKNMFGPSTSGESTDVVVERTLWKLVFNLELELLFWKTLIAAVCPEYDLVSIYSYLEYQPTHLQDILDHCK